MNIQLDPEKLLKLKRFEYLNQYSKPHQILFAGSSLMEQFPSEEFQLKAGLPLLIYNRGVGGFTTSEMMECLDICVFQVKPSHLFLNIGTNDMNAADYDVTDLMQRYEKMIHTIREHLPEVQITLLAYYPVNHLAAPDDTWFIHRTNSRISEANRAVKALSERMGLFYLNLNKNLTDADGNLKAEFTIDGVHMYPNGYREVWKELLPVLRNLN